MGKTHNSITIQAPVDQVWSAIRNFHDVSWAPNVFTKITPIGDTPGDTIGAVRLLNDAFRETLKELDDQQREFAYSIDEAPSPISKEEVDNFMGRVKVTAAEDGDGTKVEWSSSWKRNDEPASEFLSGVYEALLNDMKKSLE